VPSVDSHPLLPLSVSAPSIVLVYITTSALELLGCRDLTGEICGGRVRHEGLSDSFLDIFFCEPSQSLNRVTVPHFDLNLAV
jgi:hypothetical protein